MNGRESGYSLQNMYDIIIIRIFSFNLFADQNRLQNSNGSGPVKNNVPKSLTEHSSRSADVGYKITSRSGNNNNKLLQKRSSIAEVNPLLGRLKRTTDGMEAFIVLFQRLTADVSDLSSCLEICNVT